MSKPFKSQALFRHIPWLLLCLLAPAPTLWGATFDVPLVSLTNHNTSAYAAYNQANFGANFGPTTYVSQTTTMPIDPALTDQSLNEVTPGHVSKTDVHTLIPRRPDLRWFAHATPWFGPANHIQIGINCNTSAYVQAMVTDMKNRGFNGIILNWYGQNSTTDQVTQKLKTYLQSLPDNDFTYILMVDKGLNTGMTTNSLVAQIQYCSTNYFNDPNYEREPLDVGKPILMFFGVRNALGAANMMAVKNYTAGNAIWVEQGTGYINEVWEDQTFQWSDEYPNGVNYNDPFYLSKVTSSYATIASKSKKAFGAMCPRFNGTLTKNVAWSLGKYLPSSNALCLVQRAAAINAAIPNNMTRMQWVTWNDWEEGSQVETGIENYFALSAQFVAPNTLCWTNTSGDERTVDHYEIYASLDGVNAAFLGNVPTGTYQTNLSSVGLAPGSYKLFVDAIGKPCVRDHLSPAVTAVLQTGAAITQQPTNQAVLYGGTATFYVGATGTPPLNYAWSDQDFNPVGTNSTLVITNATQNNRYSVLVYNAYGSSSSLPATLTIITAPTLLTDVQPLSQTLYQGDPVTFAVTGGGAPPVAFQWTLNGQPIAGATNAAYSFAALPGTNYYQVSLGNGRDSVQSSTATVVGLPATYLNPADYYGLRVTFSGYTNGEALQNFPVLVRLGPGIPGFSYSQFVSPGTGADLRFTTANGRLLPFEIDQWNAAGESQVWVQVPSLASSNDCVLACWGNPADSALLPCNTNGATWTNPNGTNTCLLVYHLGQLVAPFADSTLQYPGNSAKPPGPTTGLVGGGAAFSGSQFLDTGTGPLTLGKVFTLSAWVNLSPSVATEHTLWCNKPGGWATPGFDFYVNSYNTSDGKVYFDSADGTSSSSVGARTAANAVSFGQWHLLTGTMDGVNGVVRVYVDGVDRTTDSSVNTAFPTTNYVRCGSLLTGTPGITSNQGLTGSLDEARIENGLRSPAWVWASWATVATGTFATFGAVRLPVVRLQAQAGNGPVLLSWPLGTLQAAPALSGPFTNVPGATSPYPVVPDAPQLYFRVRVQ